MNSLSIVTTVYNGEQTIGRTIESVVSQGVDVEYVIVDGASTDATLDVVRGYGDQVSVVESARDQGIYYGMNRGIELAKGDWVGIINSDDYYLPGALEKVQSMISDDVDVIHGDMIFFHDELGLAKRLRKQQGVSMFQQQPAFHPTMFVRKAVYGEIGAYDGSFALAADWEFTVRALKAGKRFLQLDDALTVMRAGGRSQRAYIQVLTEVLKILARNGAELNDFKWWMKFCRSQALAWLEEKRFPDREGKIRRLKKVGFEAFHG